MKMIIITDNFFFHETFVRRRFTFSLLPSICLRLQFSFGERQDSIELFAMHPYECLEFSTPIPSECSKGGNKKKGKRLEKIWEVNHKGFKDR